MKLHSLPFVRSRTDWLFGALASARVRWLGAVCLLVATIILAAAAWQAWVLRAALVDHQGRVSAALAAPAARPVNAMAVGPNLRGADRTRLNFIIGRLNTPWGAIFDALERESSPAVAVLAVEPDIERGAIRIQTEGRVLDELLRHAERLLQHPQFARVQLLRIDTGEAGELRLPRLTFDVVLAS